VRLLIHEFSGGKSETKNAFFTTNKDKKRGGYFSAFKGVLKVVFNRKLTIIHFVRFS
jgi:hypothetical protein